MIKLEPKNKRALMQCALGLIPATLLVKNAKLVNVITGEIYPADVFVYDGYIAHVETEKLGENDNAEKIIDAKGDYLIPGFIDAHIHIESSMLTPRNFAKGVINHGTTTVVTDPHEIANVYGQEGVRYMHEAANDLPMRQLINVPSCVPAVPGLENAGAAFYAKDIEELSKLDRVVGLAEVMDFVGVINGEDRMMDIIAAAKNAGLYIQGHAPFVTGRALSAYVIGGPKTCHESRTPKEFHEKIRNGMFVDARESSIAHDTVAAVEGTKDLKFYDNFTVCTDDREPDDILHEGHLNIVVRRLIEHGMDEVTAIKAATYNNAREINMENLGAIAPGYVADMQIVKSLKEVKPRMVFFEGKLVSENGALTEEIADKSFEIETRNSLNVKGVTLDKLTFKAENKKEVVCNVMTYPDLGLSITEAKKETLKVENGVVTLNDPDLKFVAVINRYGKGTIGFGIVRNFGTKKGAVASTVSHDSHNLTVVYDSPENALAAVNALIECGGGMAVADNGKVTSVLPLKLAGLMSVKPAAEVAKDAQATKQALIDVGLVGMENPLLRIVTLALPVIPNCKMSDLGLVDVLNKKLIPLYD